MLVAHPYGGIDVLECQADLDVDTTLAMSVSTVEAACRGAAYGTAHRLPLTEMLGGFWLTKLSQLAVKLIPLIV